MAPFVHTLTRSPQWKHTHHTHTHTVHTFSLPLVTTASSFAFPLNLPIHPEWFVCAYILMYYYGAGINSDHIQLLYSIDLVSVVRGFSFVFRSVPFRFVVVVVYFSPFVLYAAQTGHLVLKLFLVPSSLYSIYLLHSYSFLQFFFWCGFLFLFFRFYVNFVSWNYRIKSTAVA